MRERDVILPDGDNARRRTGGRVALIVARMTGKLVVSQFENFVD
jgi:hypothetical protein